MQSFVLHTHFYQPERANPWTQALDPEPSAAPFRDWNERVHRECYRANAYARIYDGQDRVVRIVNNFERLSFNLGPTLLAWMQRAHPATYRRVLAADRLARERSGHGNALAQAFHHTILPLDTPQDRRTQIHWGLADFRHRFGYAPAGMWLPETAANHAVLDDLIDEGLAFTVLAPHQAASVRLPGGDWRDVGGRPDPSRPYRVTHSDGSGRSLAVFFYDGALAQRLAFDPKAMDSQVMLDHFAGAARGGLLHAAMDGETFGHHHRFGELGLAYTLAEAAERRGFQPTSYSAYLDAHAPEAEARLVPGQGSAWSCAHGVGRWSADCGCSTDAEEGWDQQWRTPLRTGLDVVRDAAAEAFADRGAELLADPWAARDAYAEVLIGAVSVDDFIARHARGTPGEGERADLWTLLESQRNAMAMYTSCGWFFADISGIETVYVMRFAARALELLGDLGLKPPRDDLLERLGEARSNRPGVGTGADVWRDRVEPDAVTPRRVAAQTALWAAVGLDTEPPADGHDVEAALDRQRHGEVALVTGTVRVTPRATGRGAAFAVAGLGLGGLDVHAVAAAPDEEARSALATLARDLTSLPPAQVLDALGHRLGGRVTGIDDALPSARAELVAAVRAATVRAVRHELAEVVERHEHQLRLLRAAGAAGAALPADLEAIEQVRLADEVDGALDSLAAQPWRISEHMQTLERAVRDGHDAELSRLRMVLGAAITDAVSAAVAEPVTRNIDLVATLADAAAALDLRPDVAVAQEAVYDLAVAAGTGETGAPTAAGVAELAVAAAGTGETGAPTAAGVAELGRLLGISPTVWGG